MNALAAQPTIPDAIARLRLLEVRHPARDWRHADTSIDDPTALVSLKLSLVIPTNPIFSHATPTLWRRGEVRRTALACEFCTLCALPQ